ncbi:uncharacterized protein [Epargyreus clarus]|uniref:uncharacterized protein n=1 Tax=Epargyreus clarus TaxID=520877 RepID=UPI003C301776
MSSIKIVLNNILNKNNKFCGICFDALESNSVHIQDEVVIKKNGVESTYIITDILSSLLGEEIVNIISTFEMICKQCCRSAVNSYKFVTMSKENSIGLRDSLDNLKTCLEKTVDDLYHYNSLFVTLNPSNFSTQQYYDTKSPVTSLSSACRRLQALLNPKPHKIQNITSTKKEYDKTLKDEKPKQRRNHYGSVAIKTRDMLYDKNNLQTLSCKCCQRTYPSISSLRNHYIRLHAPKKYKCSMCNRKFGSLGLVEAHKYQSHCTLVCNECGKTFHNRHTLKMHEVGHYTRYVCEDCGRVYKSQTTYKKHIDLNICGQKTRAVPSQGKYTCDYCNKKYTQKVSLRVHIQYEHGNYKAHVCKWCDKKFWAQSRLKAHIVKHTQEKKFGCDICGGRFVSKESLLYHTRTHTGDKPYQCHLCDSHFISASRRADHIKRHHMEATYQCEFCNSKFVSQLCLDRHKKVHMETDDNLKSGMQDPVSVSEEDNIYLAVS